MPTGLSMSAKCFMGWVRVLMSREHGLHQVSNGMAAPFPLNIVFLPVTACETYLQWVVTWMQ